MNICVCSHRSFEKVRCKDTKKFATFQTFSYFCGMKRLLEVCTGSLASVEAAAEGGAARIELCAALPLDGLTPSLGLLEYVRRRYPQLKIHVLIRPREGDFVYTPSELQTMLADMELALPWADGFVSGALTAQGDVDIVATELLVRAAKGKPFTFHRAFDRCRQPLVALEQIIALGCTRLLTSGQQPTAQQGIPLLRRLCDLADGRLIIMPGGGVNTQNARLILDQTGTTEIHGSCSLAGAVTSAEEVRSLLNTI